MELACTYPVIFTLLVIFFTSHKKIYKSAYKIVCIFSVCLLWMHEACIWSTACLCVNYWLAVCILNIPRIQRSSFCCLGKSLQTSFVSPFIRMKRPQPDVCLAVTLKRPLRWRWTPSLTWMCWCLSFQTRSSLPWPHTSPYRGPILRMLVRKGTAFFFHWTTF